MKNDQRNLSFRELAKLSEDELREYCLSRPYADIMVDFVFKKVFAGAHKECKESLIALLNAILPDKNIVDLQYQATEKSGDKPTSKKFILDLLCLTKDNTRFIVEVQNYGMLNFFERCMAYAARLYSEHGKAGSPYEMYTPIYVIALLSEGATMNPNHKIHRPEYDDKVVYRYDFSEKESREVPSETISLIFVELEKFTKTLDECESQMDMWFYLFKNIKDMTDLPVQFQSRVFEYIFETANIKKFTDMDNSIYIHELFAEMDEFNRLYSAEVIGRREGRKEGLEEGAANTQLEIARKMKAEGLNLDIIVKCTGLSEEQIETL